MERKSFNKGFAALVNAFAHAQERISPESQEIYWTILKDIPDDLWLEGVEGCLCDCKFFPSINELGAACCGEQEIATDPFAHLTPWVKPATRRITWRENLDKILSRKKSAAELDRGEAARLLQDLQNTAVERGGNVKKGT